MGEKIQDNVIKTDTLANVHISWNIEIFRGLRHKILDFNFNSNY